MNKLILYLTVFLFSINSGQAVRKYTVDKKNSINTIERVSLQPNKQQNDWQDLKKYIGKYSKGTDFFKNPIVKNELKRILVSDYKLYQEHIAFSGCGEISYKYGLIYGDVSQLHVGGYSSLFFINIKDKKMYLFWLKETVRAKKYKIYGDKPIPSNVLNIIEEEMNIGWGHVATFKVKGDSIVIEPK